MKEQTWKNNYGQELTFEELEQLSDEIARGDFSGWEAVGDVRYGSILPNVESTTVTCTIPIEMNRQLSDLAKENNCTVNDLVRSFVTDGLFQVRA